MALRKAKPNSNSTAAYGYVRVSTEQQVGSGVSLEAQQAAIRAHCAARGLTLAELLVEPGVSAAKVPLKDRPEGSRLHDAIRSGKVGVVIVYKLDRAFRNAVETLIAVEEWEQQGVALHLLDLGGMSVDTSTAMGKMFLTMLAGLAEMERNVVSERTTMSLQHKKAAGELVGEAPVGYRAVPSGRFKRTKDGKDKPIMVLQADPREQAAITRMRDLHAEGLSLRRICEALTQEGYKPRGSEWRSETVRRIVLAQG